MRHAEGIRSLALFVLVGAAASSCVVTGSSSEAQVTDKQQKLRDEQKAEKEAQDEVDKKLKDVKSILEVGDDKMKAALLDTYYKEQFEAERQIRIDRGQHFQLTAGTVMLNPYTLVDDGTGTGFVVDNDADTDTRVFLEAAFNYRTAWLTKNEKNSKDVGARRGLIPDDYEARLGLVGGADDTSGSIAPGSGDAYFETMFGWNLSEAGKPGGHRHTINLEALLGLTTNRGAQDIHDYRGLGLTSVWSIERADDARPVHVLVGGFWSQFETPDFGNSDVITSDKGYPEFREESGVIWRGDMHIPLGKIGYATLSGRFYSGVDDLNPWTVSLGYTVPFAELLGSSSDGG